MAAHPQPSLIMLAHSSILALLSLVAPGCTDQESAETRWVVLAIPLNGH